MAKMNKNSLTIKRAYFEDVTKVPHFPIELRYEGYNVSFEDIYFDNLDALPMKFRELEKTRKGEVLLDGGFCVKILFKATRMGGVAISFTTEQFEPIFPGRCIIEGRFSVDGEMVKTLVDSFDKLFSDGTPVVI